MPSVTANILVRIVRPSWILMILILLWPPAAAVGQVCFEVQRFQDETFPSSAYSGTRDAWIDGSQPTHNNGGVAPIRVDGDSGGAPRHSLVRWDISALPAGATIQAVALTLTAGNASDAAYEIFPVLRPWAENTVTWNAFDSGLPWTTPGAGGVGTDRGAIAIGATPDDDQRGIRTIVLNATGVQRVQDWLDGVQPNHGFIIVGGPATAIDDLNLRSREETDPNQRPMFSIYYTTGSGSCLPLTCFAVADSGDRTVSMSSVGAFTDVGAAGVRDIEAIALALDGVTLYGANGGQIGTIDTTTGAFSFLGNLGSAGGDFGEVVLDDADSLSFDPLTGLFYGVHRRTNPGESDILVQIDPVTGAHIPDAFGAGVDYVPVPTLDVGGVILDDIDDIAIDPENGQMYGIANASPDGDQDHLVRLDKLTGAITSVGATTSPTGSTVEDVEGLGFYNDGSFYASTGNLSSITEFNDVFWFVDKNSAVLIPIAGYQDTYADYESMDCLSAGQNTLSGTVFIDDDTDGLLDAGEVGIPNIEVRIYIDVNNDGAVDPGDIRIRVLETDASGFYSHTTASELHLVADIDEDDADFPMGSPGGLTTDNIEEADFIGWGNDDPDNDFGWNALVPVELMEFSIE